MPFKRGDKRPANAGRKEGTPNKATMQAREAIAQFVDGNSHRLQEWLDRVADGIPKKDPVGNATGEYVVPPNPEKAFNLFQSVIEYHIPKLARTEQTGADGGAIKHETEHTIRFVDRAGRDRS